MSKDIWLMSEAELKAKFGNDVVEQANRESWIITFGIMGMVASLFVLKMIAI